MSPLHTCILAMGCALRDLLSQIQSVHSRLGCGDVQPLARAPQSTMLNFNRKSADAQSWENSGTSEP